MATTPLNVKPKSNEYEAAVVARTRSRFARSQARLRQEKLRREADEWHEVPRRLSAEQVAELPLREVGDTNHFAVVWVEYFHRALGWVVAQGCYSAQTGAWIARYEPEEMRDIVKQVEVIAWAPIQPGARPCAGPIVPRRLSEMEPPPRLRSRR